MESTTRIIAGNAGAVESPIVADRWLIWIDTVEIVVGRDLRRHDADLDAALNAFMSGTTALNYANSIRYPHMVSVGLLRLTLGVLLAGIVTVCLLAWYGGAR